LRELLGHAAAVVDAPVGGPAVLPSGQKCPFYWTPPGLRQSSQLSAQKARHKSHPSTQPLNPTVPQTSQKALTCPMSERTHLICGRNGVSRILFFDYFISG